MRSKRRSSPEIELTPLVDVVFQLIIFFVLTAAFVQGSITVSLPEGTGQPVSQTPLVINVDQNGEIFVNDEKAEIPKAVGLAREVVSKGRPILLAGDKRTPYEAIVRVLNALKEGGIDEISLAVGGGNGRTP